MGMLDLFKKKTTPTRTAVVTAAGPAFYDMLARKVTAQSATLSPDSVENIRRALAPLAKMGADIDGQLQKIKVEVDTGGRPTSLVLRTVVGGKPMGPQTTFTVEPIDAQSCRVRASMTTPSGGGMMDKLLSAGLSRKIEQDSEGAFDQPITDAAKTLGATAKFES